MKKIFSTFAVLIMVLSSSSMVSCEGDSDHDVGTKYSYEYKHLDFPENADTVILEVGQNWMLMSPFAWIDEVSDSNQFGLNLYGENEEGGNALTYKGPWFSISHISSDSSKMQLSLSQNEGKSRIVIFDYLYAKENDHVEYCVRAFINQHGKEK